MFAVISGGSGSGKSEYAENLLLALDARAGRSPKADGRYYIATMYPFDDESHQRIRRHREMRKEKGFETIECYTGLDRVTPRKGSSVLLECMSNLTANEFYMEAGAKEESARVILGGIRHLLDLTENLVVVTNEVFSDGILYDPSTTDYMKLLGEVNREMAELSDVYAEVVYTIPVFMKGKIDV